MTATRPTIAFVGLGNMGRPMATRLARAGHPLRVFDLSAEATAAFMASVADFDCMAAAGLAAAADGADFAITMLPDGAAVRAAVLGEGGLAAGLAKDAIIIDMSSSAPLGTAALGEELAARGLALIDAPVSGGVKKAVTGELAIMAGGDAGVVERCRPLFEVMGARLFHTGKLGSGQAIKALNNLVSAAGMVVVVEALLIGQRFGLAPEVMVDVLNASTGRSNTSENKLKQYVLPRKFESGFGLDLMVKDLGTALDLAAAMDTAAPASALALEQWSRAAEFLGAGADHTAIAQWVENVAGVTLERTEPEDE